MFDFFDTNFDHSYYLKYEKYNMVYYIMYFKYIFEFFFHILNKTSDQSWYKKIKHQTFRNGGRIMLHLVTCSLFQFYSITPHVANMKDHVDHMFKRP
jgi:hypothetical protein